MLQWKKWPLIGLTLLLLAATTLSCSLLSTQGGASPAAATPTSTEMAGDNLPPTSTPDNPCEGLSGTIEMQLLVGPAEAVGLAPYTFAFIPFQVTREGEAYIVSGGGPVEYYQDVLTADWGSFSVTFDGDTTISGVCLPSSSSGTLDVRVEMDGQQMVVVVVDGMETSYPWEGSPQVNASFPLVEGAEVSGEGWLLVLHLN